MTACSDAKKEFSHLTNMAADTMNSFRLGHCEKIYTRKGRLKLHVIKHHGQGEVTMPQTYPCQLCAWKFQRQGSLTWPLKINHNVTSKKVSPLVHSAAQVTGGATMGSTSTPMDPSPPEVVMSDEEATWLRTSCLKQCQIYHILQSVHHFSNPVLNFLLLSFEQATPSLSSLTMCACVCVHMPTVISMWCRSTAGASVAW